MLKITYVGPHADGVEVPALEVVVAQGETIEVAEDELALSLLEQPDNWAPVSPSAASKKRHDAEPPASEEAGDPAKDGE